MADTQKRFEKAEKYLQKERPGDALEEYLGILEEIGYRGYICYELCHQLPVVNGETVGMEFANKNAQLAAEFMREIIRSEYAAKTPTAEKPELIGLA